MIEHWIIPCNVKKFNIIEHFKLNSEVVWKNSFTIHKGDVVYIYVGSPYGEIRYKCEVISDQVDDDLLQQNSYAIVTKTTNNYFSKKIKYIQLKLLKEYPEKKLPLSTLKENGLGQVQIQARTDRNLQRYLDKIDEEHIGGEE